MNNPWEVAPTNPGRDYLLQRGREGSLPALRILRRLYGLRLPLVEKRLGIDLSDIPVLPDYLAWEADERKWFRETLNGMEEEHGTYH